MTHTPAPWHVKSCSFYGYLYTVQYKDEVEGYSHVIADICNREPALANAHLIAAAPDLLSALQDAIGALEQDLDAGKDGGDADWEGLAYQRLEAAHAAIAKARGETA